MRKGWERVSPNAIEGPRTLAMRAAKKTTLSPGAANAADEMARPLTAEEKKRMHAEIDRIYKEEPGSAFFA